MSRSTPRLQNDAPRKPASLLLLLSAFAAYSAAHFVNNSLFELPAPRAALLALEAASGGWIEPVLVRSQVVLLAFLFVVLVVGRRRPAEVGWSARKLLPGLATTLGAWVVLQLGLFAWVLRHDQPLELHSSWARVGIAGVLSGVLTQAFGHALVEDTAFRGFFLPALRARFVRPASLLALAGVLLVGVAGSSLLFGLAHLPTRALLKGSGFTDLLGEQWEFYSAGVALGVAFIVTRNLFTVVGLHVLLNAPAPLVQVPGAVLRSAILCVFALVVILSGLRSARKLRRRRAELREEREALARRAA